METVQKADPALRRTAQRLVAAALIVGLPLLGWSLPAFNAWLLQHPPARALELAGALLAALPMPLVVLGLYLAALGRRVLLTGQFPPPALRVVRDTPIRTGTAARPFGYGLVALGLLIAILAAVMAIGFPYLLFRLAHA